MNIILIGYRGSGKSTVGRLLAEKLGRKFVDTDALIATKAGTSIKEIFATRGEKAFRDLEAAAVAEVAAMDDLVIATGGGVVLRADNVTALRKNGRLIYLAATAQVLCARLEADPATAATRPALTNMGDALREVAQVLAVREPLYRAAADVTLDVTGLTAEVAAQQLMQSP